MKRLYTGIAVVLALACPIAFAGCDKDDDNNPTVDSSVDTNLDTGWDTMTDPTPDPTPDPISETIPDTTPDVLPDTGCTSGTVANGGICNLIDQCGCAPGSLCVWNVNTTTCVLYEECYAAAPGTIAAEGACNPSATTMQCVPGADCLSTDGVNGTCYEWCRDATDCSMTGRECNVPVSFTLPSPCTGSATPPYMACSQGCPADEACDPFTEGPCGAGNSCMWDPDCNILGCVPAGTATTGQVCTSVGCVAGNGCYTTTANPTAQCYAYCDGTHTCATGTCAALGYAGNPALGVCQ